METEWAAIGTSIFHRDVFVEISFLWSIMVSFEILHQRVAFVLNFKIHTDGD